MFDWAINTPLINYHSILTLKSMLSFKLLSFDFSLKETLILLKMLVKTIHCKTEKDIGKYYPWYSQKNLQKFRQVSPSGSFQFWWLTILNIQVLGVKRRLCQLQINSTVMASLYIFKLKINVKLQEKTLARWDM